MSSILYKALPSARIPLVRYSARSKRLNKAEVQLLKDFPNVGVKGQIVKVSHSLMRNTLHRYNGAAYILPNQGPRIPVVKPKRNNLTFSNTNVETQVKVEKPKPIEIKPEIKQQPKQQSKPEIKIPGLLLNIPTNSQSTPKTNISPSDSLSLFKLSRELSTSLTINKPGLNDTNLSEALTKKDIVSFINSSVTSKIQESNLEIKSNSNETINKIELFDDYNLLIWKDEENIAINLTVSPA
ncbi:hypothetical protein BN7_6514 [Wickerhamomyces ciferrii]|uniref:Ribosomal protein L9 domain-containing protein n=1 Tax=Wickerhamomyces ciferrii (strain ATCC 14091 / BCRC 22168 / CBS 111 / JCM 3599 / NBRC 0793 / NRRL Y-1031 F-60-10) TaxID=1206466 RepID=K0KZY0_WICCF|nr:uncharacterized protein BN7_6514 [Wickerhamomyces ciferrii]CCH46909.1 hypothetical protein BN7_6514 [Wickerhamomyces ciferrii]